MPSSLEALENRWAVEAMIASYNHIHQVVDHTTYHELGAISVTDHGEAPDSAFQVEFLAMDGDPGKVIKAVRKYKLNQRNYVLNVFHEMTAVREIKAHYTRHKLEFLHTQPILGMDLPGPNLGGAASVRTIKTREELDRANRALNTENEGIPTETLKDMHIYNLIAEWEGHITGWLQLVTASPGVGYIHHVHTLAEYRNQRVGSSLIAAAHEESARQGLIRMVLVPSGTTFGVFRRFGYRPLAYFTVFRPKE